MLDLDQAIRERHRRGCFLPPAGGWELGRRPSPGRCVRRRLKHPAVAYGVRSGAPGTASSPPARRAQRRPPNSLPAGVVPALRIELALKLRSMGIAIEDTARHAAASPAHWSSSARRWPHVCMHRDLGQRTPSSWGVPANVAVGLDRRGLGTCVEVSIAGIPRSSARRLAIPRNCRFCAAWRSATPTQTSPANRLHIGARHRRYVVFLDS